MDVVNKNNPILWDASMMLVEKLGCSKEYANIIYNHVYYSHAQYEKEWNFNVLKEALEMVQNKKASI